MRNRLLALTTAIVVAIAVLAADAQQSPAADRLEKLIRDRVDSGMAIGLVVGVLEADGTRRTAAYGTAGPGAKPLSDKSIFEIGSITKVFTGTLLADMAARGVLAVDDPAQKHAPEMMRLPTRGEKPITLLDLSTHHSGLPRLPDNLAPKDPANPYVDYTLERLNAFLQGYTLTRDIGATFEYSNLGTGLLGAILANRAGTGYESLVRERILSPLGMTMTGVQVSAAMAPESAIGHNAAGVPVPAWISGVLVGAGGLRSNVDDMLKFLDANIGPPKSALERAMRTAHEPRRDAGGMRIGLNWLTRTVGQDRIVWHNGGTGGFRTFIGFDPERQIGAVVLSNSAHGVDDIGFHLINAAVPLLPTAVQLPPEKLRRYAGVYELAPEFRIDVTVEGGRIYIQATKQPRFEILPQSETEFFVRAFEARITFVVENSETTVLILRQGGLDQRARRLR
jgi:D-alanyl-D-alanine-carboxypeptidase/D-alanyl-D-alanine-endopeptidase